MSVRKIAAMIATVIGCAAVGVAAAPVAGAATGNVVVFGDSFSANPDQIRNAVRGVPGPVGDWANDYPQTNGCLQAPNNVSAQLRGMGRIVDDWSCAGQTSGSMLSRVDQAIAAGKVTNGSTVVMAVGMNDFGPIGAVKTGTGGALNPAAVAGSYRSNIQSAANRVRSVAPNARLVVSGAIPTVDRGSMMFCSVNVVPDHPAGFPIPVIRDVENWNRDNQKTAARQVGATYVEMIDGARGHDTCASDSNRYVAGIIDTTTDYNMAFHPSAAGSA